MAEIAAMAARPAKELVEPGEEIGGALHRRARVSSRHPVHTMAKWCWSAGHLLPKPRAEGSRPCLGTRPGSLATLPKAAGECMIRFAPTTKKGDVGKREA